MRFSKNVLHTGRRVRNSFQAGFRLRKSLHHRSSQNINDLASSGLNGPGFTDG